MAEHGDGPQVLIIGAQGVLADFLRKAFSGAGWRVTRAGRRPDGGEDYLQLDLNDEAALGAAIEAADITVNTAYHPPLGPERVALDRSAILLDLPELGSAERRRLHERSSGSRGLVISDAGLSGIGSLALAEKIDANPEADAASYALMFSANGTDGRAGALFAHALLTDSRRHATKRVELPKPWGTITAFEVGTGRHAGHLPQETRGVPMRYYLSLRPRPLHELLRGVNAAGLMSFLPSLPFTAGAGTTDRPSEEQICELATLSQAGREIAAVTIEGRGYYQMTSTAILSYAEALVAAEETPTGYRGLDQALAFSSIAEGIAARGIRVGQRA